MSFRVLLSRALTFLVPLTVAATVYLYLYPVFNGCAFPLPQPHTADTNGSSLGSPQQNAVINTVLQHLGVSAPAAEDQPAIFRLLVLADPQLEGDTSLPFPEYELIPRVRSHWRAVQEAASKASTTTQPPPLSLLDHDVLASVGAGLYSLFWDDVPRALRSFQKRVDLLGNDYYLAHIYRTLFWWTRPTHTTVLGDLVGSQWINDEEFAWRGQRYWERVFRGGQRVDDALTRTGAVRDGQSGDDAPLEALGPSADPAWPRRLINIVGNHDIGYAGDVSEARMERFERVFGRANWDVRFQHPPVSRRTHVSDTETGGPVSAAEDQTITPTLHLINLNSLTLDGPALSPAIQAHTYTYLNDLISSRLSPVEDRSTFTLLLTHVPLHKEDGICADGPYATYHESDDKKGDNGTPRWTEGGLREQNHLSDYASGTGILQGLFGMSGDSNVPGGGWGRNGLILTGHDHVGCDAVHFVDHDPLQGQEKDSGDSNAETPSSQAWQWAARCYNDNQHTQTKASPSIREVTLRSMMGEFGGNAGLLSAWFDPALAEWRYEITMCPAGVQHIWWAVHVLILVTLIVALLWFIAGQFTARGSSSKGAPVSSKSAKFTGKEQSNRASGGRSEKKPKARREQALKK
ncbi:hypothetical protein NUU61_005101 [Penicillium alfredii]|uniref:Calcineurin-like phosphoesterase domain-containing protein n=1 Tax=Penicillium alfredii TaxID=1506179 RepID=A0A9W9K7K0_9EURO|nr:uncharacterized protein NUU61_005101 [Penicillium alfredii]KAJ5095745.1 hypothetical protein NUU61_005101 [Penicillium alfredii]